MLHPVMVDIALQSLGATKIATDLAAAEDRSAPPWWFRSACRQCGFTET